jgi:hypothetical protein
VALPPGMAFMESAWPRTKGIPSWAQRSASQVPGEDAFDANHHVLPVGGNSLEKGPRCCLQIPMQKDLAILIQDADVHGPGMQVNATVEFGLFGVESPEGSSS